MESAARTNDDFYVKIERAFRNLFEAADYIGWNDGLRLPKRNGGYARNISWEEFNAIFERGVNFFHILRHVVGDYVQSDDPPKTIKARLQEEPEMDWTIYCDPKSGAFGTSGKYPKET